jgi:hypothetical protein
MSPARAMAMAAGKTAEEFGSSLGNVVFLKTEAQVSRIKSLIPSWGKSGGAASTIDATGKNFIFIDPTHVGRSFEERAVKMGMAPEAAKRATQSEDFLKTVLYHEQLEREVSGGFAKTRIMPTKHAGSQVMIGEGGFVAGLENKEVQELFRTVRGKNAAERKSFALGEFLFSKPAKIGDPVNPIEGMKHGGLAEKLRKIYTMFGSKYDLLKGFLKMGEKFEEMVGTSSFKSALAMGEVIKPLGGGTFGDAFLMRSSFRGKMFEYVKKDIALDTEKIGEEMGFLKDLSHTATVPSPYGRTDSSIYMEFMPGKQVQKYRNEAIAKLTPKMERDLRETIDEAAFKGIRNLDIHGGNVLTHIDPVTGEERLAWLDFGAAQRVKEPVQEVRAAMEFEMQKMLKGEHLHSTRGALAKSAEQLKSDKIKTWKNASQGGSGHLSRNTTNQSIKTERR